jgi:hypothetical protein
MSIICFIKDAGEKLFGRGGVLLAEELFACVFDETDDAHDVPSW